MRVWCRRPHTFPHVPLVHAATSNRLVVLDPPPLAPAAGGPPIDGRTPVVPAAPAAAAAAALSPRRRGAAGLTASACYSPTGHMLLWGNCLYDLRSGSAVHQFDQFTDSGSGAFHPSGLEVRTSV